MWLVLHAPPPESSQSRSTQPGAPLFSRPWTGEEARALATYISFSPFLFQAIATMRDTGLLRNVYDNRRRGVTVAEAAQASGVSEYGVKILRDLGRSIGLFFDRPDERFSAAHLAHFLLDDELTRVNFEFTQHFAWSGLDRLREALVTETPAGLGEFGDWPTLYPAIPTLPKEAREAWYAFDHFYSDSAFLAALDAVFADPPRELLDIGGNTGRFARQCLARNADVRLVVQDLPEQLALAREGFREAGWVDRFTLHPTDALDTSQPFHQGADAAWMSQFLCCFSPEQIVSILERTRDALAPGGRIFVLETFWDRQHHPSADYALHATSLYFACFANGNSRMYGAVDFVELVAQAGLTVVAQQDGLGEAHTLLTLSA